MHTAKENYSTILIALFGGWVYEDTIVDLHRHIKDQSYYHFVSQYHVIDSVKTIYIYRERERADTLHVSMIICPQKYSQ